LAKTEPVIALRERARALPPTWKDTLSKQRTLLANQRARWLDIESDDCANLLALDELLQAARSGDVTNARGEPLGEASVVEWVKAELDVPNWKLVAALAAPNFLSASDGTSERGDDPSNLPDLPDAAEPAAATSATSQHALATLRRLRIASVDRLVREVARIEPTVTRAAVLAELEAAGKTVSWFGRAILCVRDAS
ncbi:MAG TPA: hypothetical protein VFQ35_26515, partial [Polyangiaceae bacterium]|nr:hypothetical protein [Polyangiaceae bacterium]